MGLKVGICGAGVFARAFVPLFMVHPGVESVAVADIVEDKARKFAADFGIDRVYRSLTELCESDVDAVALFSQNTMHGPQSVEALRAGKHVYSAVPAAVSLEQLATLVGAVEDTSLVYMTGETSYYYPSVVYCRNRFRSGDFGEIVYGEAEYFHDMSDLYEVYQHRFGDEWRRNAGIPPMYYPTHSTSMIVSVTGARITQVSCMGFVDHNQDKLFGATANLWGNPFSNEVALCRMSDGSIGRFNEFRRVAEGGGRGGCLRLYGTEGSFEQEASGRCTWTQRRSGGGSEIVDVTDELVVVEGNNVGTGEGTGVDADWSRSGMAEVHPVARLPAEFRGLPSGHYGSHHFLVDDFISNCLNRTAPPNSVWEAARYLAPGLRAHDSAARHGELLEVPDFGHPPTTLIPD
ncbi:MAG TPA: Gfo/Idh/MocA family oxidoreductase [Mycobacteriales bacterium]|nr:Gfo/Idh/MocA family oxidoreductase [Mycobacteriales bacterium]